jgi:hypothetical protein
MMEDEFYAIIKLISGEEIFSVVMPSEEDGRILLILSNPVIIETVTIKNLEIQGIKIDPWLKFADDDTFILDMDKVITMSEVKDKETIEVYKKFLKQKNNKKTVGDLTPEMGYLSTVSQARIRFEKLYKAADKPNP